MTGMEEPANDLEEMLRRPQFVFTEMGDGRIVTFGHPTLIPAPAQGLVEEAFEELAALSRTTPEDDPRAIRVTWLG